MGTWVSSTLSFSFLFSSCGNSAYLAAFTKEHWVPYRALRRSFVLGQNRLATGLTNQNRLASPVPGHLAADRPSQVI